MTYITKEKVKLWAVCAAVRALKTFAYTAVGLIPAGIAIQDVGWPTVLGSAALAALLSLLGSIAGIPEVDDGESLPGIVSGGGKHAA